MQLLELIPAPCGAPKITLSPSQRKAADGILPGLQRGDCVVLQDFTSHGKSTVLDYVHKEPGGSRIGVREFLTKLAALGPMAIEEAFLDLVDREIEASQGGAQGPIIVDDLHLIKNVVESCDYTRQNLFDAVMTAVLASASAARRKLLFATGEIPVPLSRQAHAWSIADLPGKTTRPSARRISIRLHAGGWISRRFIASRPA